MAYGSDVIHLLWKMAGERRSIVEMVRTFLPCLAAGGPRSFEALRSFRVSFGLTVLQAKPIADWVAHGDKPVDSDLHMLVWPYIELNREYWEWPTAPIRVN